MISTIWYNIRNDSVGLAQLEVKQFSQSSQRVLRSSVDSPGPGSSPAAISSSYTSAPCGYCLHPGAGSPRFNKNSVMTREYCQDGKSASVNTNSKENKVSLRLTSPDHHSKHLKLSILNKKNPADDRYYKMVLLWIPKLSEPNFDPTLGVTASVLIFVRYHPQKPS